MPPDFVTPERKKKSILGEKIDSKKNTEKFHGK